MLHDDGDDCELPSNRPRLSDICNLTDSEIKKMSHEELCKSLKSAVKKVQSNENSIRQLKNHNRRLQRSEENLKIKIAELKCVKSDNILDLLKNGKFGGNVYRPEVKDFVLSMFSISPAAYLQFKIQVHPNILPGRSTILRWIGTHNGAPGMCTQSLEMMEKIQNHRENENLPLILWTAVTDEMAIKASAIYDPHRKKISGCVDLMCKIF